MNTTKSTYFANGFHNRGELHPAYKNGSGIYRYRDTRYKLSLANFSCEICLINNKRLIVHHIDQNPRNNNTDNLKVLCNSCHRKVHSKYYGMTPQEKLLIINENKKKYYRKKHPCLVKGIKIDGYITRNEASQILNVSRERIRQLVSYGKIRSLAIGKTGKRYLCNELDVLNRKTNFSLKTDLPCAVADGQQGIEG